MSATQGLPDHIGAFEVIAHLGRGRTSDVYEVRSASGERLALKWLQGVALRDAATAIRTGPGPAAARFGAIAAPIADIADALGAMHDAALIHRDLRAAPCSTPKRRWLGRLADKTVVPLPSLGGA